MNRPGSGWRGLLTIGWCALVGAGYFLPQFLARIGSPLIPSDPLQRRLEMLYAGFLILFLALGLYDFWYNFRSPGRLQSEYLP